MSGQVEQLKRLTGESDEQLLSLLLVRAEALVLAHTNRTKVTSRLQPVILEVALYLHTAQGNDGVLARSEGGISLTYKDGLPRTLEALLDGYKIVRCGGRAFEK